LIFYEPVTWGMVLNGEIVGSGFKHVPGGPAYNDRSVFSYHYYCWFDEGALLLRPSGFFVVELCCHI
jgi:hypothetical protein